MSSNKQIQLPKLDKARSNSKGAIAPNGRSALERLPSISQGSKPNKARLNGTSSAASYTPSSSDDYSESESEDSVSQKASTPKRSAKFSASVKVSSGKSHATNEANLNRSYGGDETEQDHFDYRHRKSLGKVVTFKSDETKPIQLSKFYKKELEIPSVKMDKFLNLISKSKWNEASVLCRKFLVMQPSNKTLREFLVTLQSLIIINNNLKSFSKKPAATKTTNRSKGDGEESLLGKNSKEKSRLSELKSTRSMASALNDEIVPNLTNEEKLTVLESALDSLRKEASLDKTANDLTKLSMRTISAKTTGAANEPVTPKTADAAKTANPTDTAAVKETEPVKSGPEQDEQREIDKILEDFYSIK